MREYKFHSALSPEEIAARLRKRTRPWSRWDVWTARNTWFWREKGKDQLRLIRTGPARSYVFADLTLAGSSDGTEITAVMSTAKTYLLDIVLVVLLVLGLVCMFYLRDMISRPKYLLECGGVLLLLIWTGSLTRKQLPELVTFIEDNLLNE